MLSSWRLFQLYNSPELFTHLNLHPPLQSHRTYFLSILFPQIKNSKTQTQPFLVLEFLTQQSPGSFNIISKQQIDNNMNNNHAPKEPIPPNTVYSSRDRPLQKSMFLPEHYPPAPPLHPQTSNQASYNPLKRSLIDNTGSGPGNQYQFRTNPNNNTSLHTFQPPKPSHAPFTLIEQRSGSSHQLLHHSNSTSNMKPMSSIGNSVEYEPKSFNKIDKGKPSFEVSDFHNQGPTSQASLINQVVNQIKDKHLPSLVSVVKKELHQEISLLRQEFMSFKEEVKGQQMKQEMINTELKGQVGQSRGSQNYIQGRNSIQKDKELTELQKDFFLLEGKMKKIESSLNERLQHFGTELDKISIKSNKQLFEQPQKKLSTSTIRSQLSPILLEYKQIFAIKTTQDLNRRGSFHEQIIISQCHYYIDKHGYLMDNENRYLIDRRGSQVKLDDKHLKLLERHKILK